MMPLLTSVSYSATDPESLSVPSLTVRLPTARTASIKTTVLPGFIESVSITPSCGVVLVDSRRSVATAPLAPSCKFGTYEMLSRSTVYVPVALMQTVSLDIGIPAGDHMVGSFQLPSTPFAQLRVHESVGATAARIGPPCESPDSNGRSRHPRRVRLIIQNTFSRRMSGPLNR